MGVVIDLEALRNVSTPHLTRTIAVHPAGHQTSSAACPRLVFLQRRGAVTCVVCFETPSKHAPRHHKTPPQTGAAFNLSRYVDCGVVPC